MQEISSFDKLIEYPQVNGLVYETHRDEKRFIVSTSDPILNTKYVTFEKGSLLFLAYDSFGAKAFMNQTFTGVFKIFPKNIKCDISIFKREWADNIFRRKRVKTYNNYVDKNLTIISKKGEINLELINKDFVKDYFALNDIVTPIELLIKFDYLGFLTKYTNKNIVGVETNQWISETKDINSLISQGEILIDKILYNTKC